MRTLWGLDENSVRPKVIAGSLVDRLNGSERTVGTCWCDWPDCVTHFAAHQDLYRHVAVDLHGIHYSTARLLRVPDRVLVVLLEREGDEL